MLITFGHKLFDRILSFAYCFLIPLFLLLGNVVARTARNSADDLKKREGLRKQLDDITKMVKTLQEEFENDGKNRVTDLTLDIYI